MRSSRLLGIALLVAAFVVVGFAGWTALGRGVKAELLSKSELNVVSNTWHDGEYYIVGRDGGEDSLTATSDFRRWTDIQIPTGRPIAVGQVDNVLRLAIVDTSGDLVFFDRTADDQWEPTADAVPSFDNDVEIQQVLVGDGGTAVLYIDDPEGISKVTVMGRGQDQSQPVSLSSDGSLVSHPEGVVVQTGIGDEKYISFSNGVAADLNQPDGIVFFASTANGSLLGFGGLGNDATSLFISKTPFETWEQLAALPEAEAEVNQSCGGRFDASPNGDVILFYPYCDGHLWVARNGGDWVRSHNMNLGDADSIVEPLTLLGDAAIINTYRGLFSIDLPK